MRDDSKPPPTSNPERVRAWVIAKLEAMDEERLDQKMKLLADPDVQAHVLDLVERQLAELRSEERALAEADCGNIEPLRKLDPKKARFLFPPELKPWQRFKPFGGQWDAEARLRCARADIPRIREISKAAYGSNRLEGELAAEKIAADRWGISVNTIRSGFPSKAARLRKNEARRRSRKKP